MTGCIPLLLTLTTVCSCDESKSRVDWNPKVYDAIKWTAPNQGKATLQYNTNHGITRIPMAYHGGVDTNASGVITKKNIDRFTDWTQQFIPTDYCGPVVLDYERPWWKELRAKTIQPHRLEEILSVYIKGMQVARRLRPAAQWGYWGLPASRHTSKKWLDQDLSIESLIRQCTALFADVYDDNRGKDRTSQTQSHISTTLKLAAGRMPVYVFVSPRYVGEGGDRTKFIPSEIFLRQVNAALGAHWLDENGVQHRIKGVILWDAYGYSPDSEWRSLDLKHAHYFELLHALTSQWATSMAGKQILVEPAAVLHCQDGLPIPNNSSAAVYDQSLTKRDSGRVKDSGVKDDRVPSERVLPDRNP